MARTPHRDPDAPNAKAPAHYKGHLSINGHKPLCGGGKKIEAWIQVIGGFDAITCLTCLRMGVELLKNLAKRKCKRCQCDHFHACRSPEGPCYWVGEDLCSDCETPKERRARLG